MKASFLLILLTLFLQACSSVSRHNGFGGKHAEKQSLLQDTSWTANEMSGEASSASTTKNRKLEAAGWKKLGHSGKGVGSAGSRAGRGVAGGSQTNRLPHSQKNSSPSSVIPPFYTVLLLSLPLLFGPFLPF